MGKTENRRIITRYALATVLATVGIFLLESYFSSNFDGVAAVGLFSCIIAVTGEDTSLGPVIYKSICRGSGACLGGICGYVLLYIPLLVMSANKKVALIVIPTLFVAMVQWLTKGGSEWLTKLVKTKKIGHLVIQLQVAFGAVFVGSWNTPQDALMTSVCRTLGILYGCAVLFIAAMVAFPQTSLHASSELLSECLRTSGGLLEALCRSRIEGRSMEPYDHSKRGFVEDEHATLLERIETILTRVVFLQPFLFIEPNWALGYPLNLAIKDTVLSKEWVTFLSVAASRLGRVRATLSAMDSNVRIDSDLRIKYFKSEISGELDSLSTGIKRSLHIVALYIESPFVGISGWRGAVSLKADLEDALSDLKREIEKFVEIVCQQVAKFNSVRDKERDVGNNKTTSDVLSSSEKSDRNLTLKSKVAQDGRYQPDWARTRSRIGDTIDAWHKIYPMRTFCTLTVQIAVQTSSILYETIRFIDIVGEHDTAADAPTASDFQEVSKSNITAEEMIELAIRNHPDVVSFESDDISSMNPLHDPMPMI